MTSSLFPPVGVITLSRMGFGPRPGDLDAFQALGSSDADRLTAYVDLQLHPDSIDDADLNGRLTKAGYTTLQKTPAQLWTDHAQSPGGDDWSIRSRPFSETERAAFLRAVYS